MSAQKKKISSFLNQTQEKIGARSLAAADHKALRLQATNEDDLDVMAVFLQDAIIPATNFHYDSDQGTFTLRLTIFAGKLPMIV